MQSDLIRIAQYVAPVVSTVGFCVVYMLIGIFNRRLKFTMIVAVQALVIVQFLLHAFVYSLPMIHNFVLNFIGFAAFYVGVKMRVIGLTGGIASGKTTVSTILKGEGYNIIDCDEISREMRRSDKAYQKEVIRAFGSEVWDPVKLEIKSDVLGDMVFNDKEKRTKLNSLSHWRIFRDIFYQIIKYRVYKGEKKVILDAPLLFETGLLEYICSPVILVYLPDKELQIERLMKRDKNLTRQKALERINSQYPIDKKIQKSQILVDNSEKVEDLERQIRQKTIPLIKKALLKL